MAPGDLYHSCKKTKKKLHSDTPDITAKHGRPYTIIFLLFALNWKIIQATSGKKIDKELMKREKESLKAIKRERL